MGEEEKKAEEKCCEEKCCEEKNQPENDCKGHHGRHKHGRGGMNNSGGTCGMMYCFTVIGAAIFFIKHATTFWGGVVGFLKALVWPVFVIMKILELLKL